MAAWVVRGGDDGGYEGKFISDGAIFLTWRDLEDLSGAATATAVRGAVLRRDARREPHAQWSEETLRQYVGIATRFRVAMKQGDIVVMPLKDNENVRIGRLKGDYVYLSDVEEPFRHRRSVAWRESGTPWAGLTTEQVAAMRSCPLQNFKLPGVVPEVEPAHDQEADPAAPLI